MSIANHRETVNNWLKAVNNQTGENFALDENGLCHICYDNDLNCFIEVPELLEEGIVSAVIKHLYLKDVVDNLKVLCYLCKKYCTIALFCIYHIEHIKSYTNWLLKSMYVCIDFISCYLFLAITVHSRRYVIQVLQSQ